jgi:GntR family transcriptional repressor for pyruvate dehydrogenase complex
VSAKSIPKPNQKQTLVEQTVDRVHALILNQQLQPGDSLPSEMRLAETLGVSRPVVREALRILAGRGMITIANGRNPIINPVNATALVQFFERATQLNAVTVIELLEVRRGIEVQCIALAAERRTPAHIQLLQQQIRKLDDARYDLALYSELDAQLHRIFALASQNQMLAYLVESLGDALRQTSLTGLLRRRNRRELDEVHRSHHALIEAVITQNTAVAVHLMAEHVDGAIAAIRRSSLDADALEQLP